MKEKIINYRRERAKETFEEAKIMFDNSKLFATVNRIYYAIFYESVALLLTKDLYSSKHSGIRSLFNREFVKAGVVGEKFGDFYNKMFEFRQRGDYEDFVEFNKEDIKTWLEKAEEFIKVIDEIVAKAIEE
ncbi:HEPN domain-containing protein [Candidatus Aerophobetes bacterium]|nr:HEPN domain-containing protein [Candidatus Aerophobetes bacterium]